MDKYIGLTTQKSFLTAGLAALTVLLVFGLAMPGCQQKAKQGNKQARAVFNKGIRAYGKNIDSAGVYFEQAKNLLLSKAGTQKDSILLAQAYNNLGAVLIEKGLYAEAAASIEQAALLNLAMGRRISYAENRINQGIRLNDQGLLSEAAAALYEAAAILNELAPAHKSLLTAYNVLGNIERHNLNYGKALQLHNKALQVAPKHKKQLIAQAYNNLGKDYLALNKFNKAALNLNKALFLKDSLGLKSWKYSTLLNLALLQEKQTQLPLALSTLKKALASARLNNNPFDVVKIQQEKARILAKMNDLQGSLQSADTARALFSTLPYKAQAQLDYLLLEHAVFLLQALPQKAANLLYPILTAKDSVNSQKQQMRLAYLTKRMDEARLNFTIEAQARELGQNSRQKLVLAIGIGLLLVLLFFLVQSIRRQLKNRKVLAAQNRQRAALLRSVNHLIRNNLASLEGFMMLEMKRYPEGDANQLLAQNRSRLNAISTLHNKLMLDKLDSVGQVQLKDYITDVVYSVLDSFEVQQDHLELKLRVEPLSMEVNKALKVGQLLCEALANACKYAIKEHAAPVLEVYLDSHPVGYLFTVADNGPGLPEKSKRRTGSLGMQLFAEFSKELGAQWETLNHNGCRHRWLIPYQEGIQGRSPEASHMANEHVTLDGKTKSRTKAARLVGKVLPLF